MVHARLRSAQGEAPAVAAIEQEVENYALPMPNVQVNPGIRQQGYRGLYRPESKTITLADANDYENGRHEALHYVSDMKTGNPLALFSCEDGSCLYHHPLAGVPQLARRSR